MSIKLSVVIPTYNEEERLPSTLYAIDDYLTKQNYGYEILVVNDGSSDNTAGVVKKLKSEINNLKLIDNKKNHGKGYVVRQGLIKSKGDYRLFTDADNSTSIDQVEKMWPYVNAHPAHLERSRSKFDVVIGSRDLEDSVLDPPQSWFREFLGGGFKSYRKLVLDLWGLEDTQCGFKLFSKKAVEEVVPKCKIDRFAFDPELLILARRVGFKIKEIPIHWVDKEGSKVGLDSIIKMGLDLFKIRGNIIIGNYNNEN